MVLWHFVISSTVLSLASCSSPPAPGGFNSAGPEDRIVAILHAARESDRNVIRNLVEQLDSDDPAVRSIAIATLYRLTGETLGYRDYDPALERRDAIQRWVDSLESSSDRPDDAASRDHVRNSS